MLVMMIVMAMVVSMLIMVMVMVLVVMVMVLSLIYIVRGRRTEACKYRCWRWGHNNNNAAQTATIQGTYSSMAFSPPCPLTAPSPSAMAPSCRTVQLVPLHATRSHFASLATAVTTHSLVGSGLQPHHQSPGEVPADLRRCQKG